MTTETLDFIATLAKVFVVFGLGMSATPVFVYAERRLCGFIQDRLGPNRVGPQGLLQPIADAIKSFFKEDIIPTNVVRVLWVIAPGMALVVPLLALVVIPFGSSVPLTADYTLSFQAADPGEQCENQQRSQQPDEHGDALRIEDVRT